MVEPRTSAEQAESTDIIPTHPEGLGEGEPPAAMVERYGMEALPATGPSDEVDGELVDPDEAVAESDRAASATTEGP